MPPRKGLDLPTRSHHKLSLAIVFAASVLAFFAIFAVWVNRQALNTNNWTDTSSKLLENDEIRAQLSDYLVDELYTNVDVQGKIAQALPPRAAPLAGPISGAIRNAAPGVVDQLLQRPRVQKLWVESNRRAHKQLLAVLKGGGDVVGTQGGDVTLDLKTLLAQTQQNVGVGGRLQQKLPADAAQITILRSNQLSFAQDVTDAVRPLAVVLVTISLLLFALAIYLARGWRRESLRAVGIGLALAGLTALVAQALAGNAVVDSLASTDSVRPAVEETWSIATSLLRQAAAATLAYGIVIVLAAWLAGPTRWAVAARSRLAPYLREPGYAYGGLFVIVLLLLVWGPTPATRRPALALILIGLLIFGTEMLRRQTAREFPAAGVDKPAAPVKPVEP
jgi:hypothetical protein